MMMMMATKAEYKRRWHGRWDRSRHLSWWLCRWPSSSGWLLMPMIIKLCSSLFKPPLLYLSPSLSFEALDQLLLFLHVNRGHSREQVFFQWMPLQLNYRSTTTPLNYPIVIISRPSSVKMSSSLVTRGMSTSCSCVQGWFTWAFTNGYFSVLTYSKYSERVSRPSE